MGNLDKLLQSAYVTNASSQTVFDIDDLINSVIKGEERGESRFCVRPLLFESRQVQRSAEVGATGLVNFITAVAYHFCPSLPAAFTQPGASTLADLCTYKQECNMVQE